jgi:hypothetical protein
MDCGVFLDLHGRRQYTSVLFDYGAFDHWRFDPILYIPLHFFTDSAQTVVVWKYTMYYVSPATYLIGGTLSAVLADLPVVCAPAELVLYSPPGGQTCGSYSADFLNTALGYLVNPNATSGCQYCSLTNATGVFPFRSSCLTVVPRHVERLPKSEMARFWNSAWIYRVELDFGVCHSIHLPLSRMVIYG